MKKYLTSLLALLASAPTLAMDQQVPAPSTSALVLLAQMALQAPRAALPKPAQSTPAQDLEASQTAAPDTPSSTASPALAVDDAGAPETSPAPSDHGPMRKKYVCSRPGCTKTYHSRQDLYKHTNTAHLGIIYHCSHPGCTKTYSTPYILKKHALTHTEIPRPCAHRHQKYTDTQPDQEHSRNKNPRQTRTKTGQRKHHESSMAAASYQGLETPEELPQMARPMLAQLARPLIVPPAASTPAQQQQFPQIAAAAASYAAMAQQQAFYAAAAAMAHQQAFMQTSYYPPIFHQPVFAPYGTVFPAQLPMDMPGSYTGAGSAEAPAPTPEITRMYPAGGGWIPVRAPTDQHGATVAK